jgi:hypothetical protein
MRGVKWEAFVVEPDENHEPENQKTRERKHFGLAGAVAWCACGFCGRVG